MTITGSGFQSGSTVTIAGALHTLSFANGTILTVTTTAHDVGAAEVVVTNPDGQAASVSGGFAFKSPDSFNFNGVWEGYALAHPDARLQSIQRHSDMDMRLTVESNLVTSVTCGGVAFTPSPPLAVSNGAFSLVGDGGVVMSGRIVSDNSAVGTINTIACPATRWYVFNDYH